MKGVSLYVTIILLISLIFSAVTILPESAKATVVYVGGGGPGNYTTIQSAANDASPGDTIYVFGGTYYENPRINRILTLIGEGVDSTIIDGGGTGTVVNISADWVNITGFTVRNGGTGAGIELRQVENCRIVDNSILGNGRGIYLYYSNNTGILNNNISSNDLYGIHLQNSDVNEIAANDLSYNSVGITIEMGSSDNSVANNLVHENNGEGIELYWSNRNTLANNTIYSNAKNGIQLYSGCNDNTIANNTLSNNLDGIYIWRSSNNTLVDNTMIENGLHLSGTSLEDWNTHTIDTSNSVNGKPVHYWKNVVGGTIPPDAGEVILANCTGVVVENQNVSNGSVGIEVGFSSGNIIRNNNAFSNNDYGVLLWSSTENVVTNNTVVSNRLGFYLIFSENNTIADSESSLNTQDGINVLFSTSNTISGNSVSSNGENGILLDWSDRNAVVGNTVSSHIYSGVRLGHASNNTLADNVAFLNRWGGIRILFSSDYNTVANNTLSNNLDGIDIWQSSSNTLVDNTMIENGLHLSGPSLEDWNTHTIGTSNTVNGRPIYYWKNVVGGTIPPDAGEVILANCTGVVVENQNMSNGSIGIEVGFSSGNIIRNNSVSGSVDGVSLRYSDSNTIYGNKIFDSYNAVDLKDSNGNRIFHNEFVNNSIQAWDSSVSNEWDDGYPSGGNYWDDYGGYDLFSGPSQDLLGSDGIGDIPHDISGGSSQDRYPLTRSPSVPQNLTAVSHSQQVTLTWSPPGSDGGSPISDYIIYRGTSPSTEDFSVEIGQVTTHNDTGLENGQTYYYRVSAENAAGEGPKTNEVSATPVDVPGPPTNVTASPGNGEVILNWSSPVNDGGVPVDNYTVYRGTSPSLEVFLVTLGYVPGFVDTGLMNGVAYFYKVAAINSVGEGPNSTEVNATPFNRIPECNITNPTSGTTVSGSYAVAGTANDTDGTVERVEIRIDDGPWTQANGTTSWSYQWNTTTLDDGNHTIYARSFDGMNNSYEVNVTVVVGNAVSPPPPDKEESIFEQAWVWVVVALVIIVVVAVLLLLVRKRKQRLEGDQTSETREPS